MYKSVWHLRSLGGIWCSFYLFIFVTLFSVIANYFTGMTYSLIVHVTDMLMYSWAIILISWNKKEQIRIFPLLKSTFQTERYKKKKGSSKLISKCLGLIQMV